MKRPAAFTLIELLVVLAILGSLLAISVTGIIKFKDSLEYASSVNQVLSAIKFTQQLADSSVQLCRIDFGIGSNTYTITKGGHIFRSERAGKNIRFNGKSYFSFVQKGFTDVGGSGTLIIGGAPKAKKIVVSSRGRVRIE